MSDKKELIKKIFSAIDSKHKENVRRLIAERFDITVDSVKFNWIYQGKIPDQNVEAVLSIVTEEAKSQSDSLLQLIDCI